MNYYSSSPSMSSRGRFSSRGGSSYRGGGRGESSYRGSRGGYSSSRGYTSSRGRGSYYASSSSKYSSDGGRYISRVEEVSYRKPESSYGSSREHSHHRSEIDIGRKRMRSDSYSQGGSGGRRSHEVDDYRSGGGRYSNSNSYSESRGYSENRGVFKKPRMSEYKTKEEYRPRREISRSSVTLSKLRSVKGRTIRGRAVRRGGDSFLARKRAGRSGGRTVSELLALRRTKMLKTRRLRERAKLRLAEEKAVLEDKKKEIKAAEEQQAKEKKLAEDEDIDDQEDEKKDKTEEGEICDGEADKEKDKEKDKKLDSDIFKKPFMKLQCPQCSTKCVTFKEYLDHLYTPTHIKAMRDKSEQLKATLAKMRIAQRANQKKADEEDVTNMNTRTMFCSICKLNYSQDKIVHQTSEAHKKLKNFLRPYCKICRVVFKSPMIYERHICSLDHMKKKNALDMRLAKKKGNSTEYLENFMVVDSVGSGDEVEDTREDKGSEDSKKSEKRGEKEINLGVEFIRRVEAFYCEVCRTYLPRIPDYDRVLRVHCSTKYHLKCYLRFGSDKLLEQMGKKIKSEGEGTDGEKADTEKVDAEGKENENHEDGGIDEKLWADVSDILSQVEPEVKSDDDDDEESGRFDRFKSNEKKENGEVVEEGLPEKGKGVKTEETNAAAQEVKM